MGVFSLISISSSSSSTNSSSSCCMIIKLTSCSTSSRISSLNSSVDSCLSAATSVSPSAPVGCVLSSSFTNNSPCSRSSAIRRSTSTSTAFEILSRISSSVIIIPAPESSLIFSPTPNELLVRSLSNGIDNLPNLSLPLALGRGVPSSTIESLPPLIPPP
ncbi:hypothetical protein FB446DRAFT_759012 [Lentinula raphanica]|nr:hypothetical protein FB446DRAFT_759012 [Lentinula raphanica]